MGIWEIGSDGDEFVRCTGCAVRCWIADDCGVYNQFLECHKRFFAFSCVARLNGRLRLMDVGCCLVF